MIKKMTRKTDFIFERFERACNNLNLNDTSSESIRKDAIIWGNQVNVLIDSGADHNIIRSKLGKKLLQRRTVRATRFDGTVSMKKNTTVYKNTVW
ncbi:hypothetical protein PsorP6_012209 [Peronosclerospora sorghi]|uniref:Uncharacterized protein n=1 Tax=Peronosclerospora sorghi TaxID=230839 RepID=A0ACC0WM33_9STRA|nr:hypothetical protein PsorP6_012209 [Peronosclerospora sorghi]